MCLNLVTFQSVMYILPDKDTDVNGIQDHTAEPARHSKSTYNPTQTYISV